MNPSPYQNYGAPGGMPGMPGMPPMPGMPGAPPGGPPANEPSTRDRINRAKTIARRAAQHWIVSTLILLVGGVCQAADPANPIVAENAREGALDWQLTRVRVDGDGFRSPWIEGYCSRQSERGSRWRRLFAQDPRRPG